jgi:hypothetical protein
LRGGCGSLGVFAGLGGKSGAGDNSGQGGAEKQCGKLIHVWSFWLKLLEVPQRRKHKSIRAIWQQLTEVC